MSENINISHFRDWEKHNITKLLMSALKRIREDIQFEMQDAGLIMDKDCRAKLARLLGMRDGLDIVLEMSFEELEQEDEDNEE